MKTTLSAALFSLAVATPASLFAVASVPQGAMSYTLTAGTLATPRLTSLSVPLRDSVSQVAYNDATKSGFTGQASGFVASVAAGTAASNNAISVTNAGWDPLQFRNAASPYLIRFMSGNATGRTLLILTNSVAHTATSVIVENQSFDLLSSVVGGDKFEIFPADTLKSFFQDMVATSAVLTHGSNPALADNIQVWNGLQWLTCFHNGTNWRLTSANINQDNLLIRPETVMLFARRGASDINFTALGTVPSTPLTVVVRQSGISPVGNLFPVSRTLSTAGFGGIAGWVATTAGSSSDKVQIHNGLQWQSFFLNSGTSAWNLVSPQIANNPTIPAGRPVLLNRLGASSAQSLHTFALPYTL